MNTYIALLRGINVSGHNKIKMVDLKQLFVDNGFENVTTYIQSGNVIFTSPEKNTTILEEKITTFIHKKYGYNTKVLALTKNYLQTIFDENPLDIPDFDIKKMCVTFLKGKPLEDGIDKIITLLAPEEQLAFKNNAVYLYCPNGYGRTKVTNTAFESKLKVSATTRNWRTIAKLIELSL